MIWKQVFSYCFWFRCGTTRTRATIRGKWSASACTPTGGFTRVPLFVRTARTCAPYVLLSTSNHISIVQQEISSWSKLPNAIPKFWKKIRNMTNVRSSRWLRRESIDCVRKNRKGTKRARCRWSSSVSAPPAPSSRVAQWKRAGPITQRSVDRNHALLVFFRGDLFFRNSPLMLAMLVSLWKDVVYVLYVVAARLGLCWTDFTYTFFIHKPGNTEGFIRVTTSVISPYNTIQININTTLLDLT